MFSSARTNPPTQQIPLRTKNNLLPKDLSTSRLAKNIPAEREVSAGGVVFRRSKFGIEIAFMKDSYDKWTFPKGHVEKGEALEEAAARETLEEIGLEEIRFLEELGKISIWFRDRYEQKGKLIHKDIYYFLFETAPDAVLLPDPSQHTYDAKWVPIKKVLQTSSYSDLAPIIKKALGYLAIR